jgi:hypothetical protein
MPKRTPFNPGDVYVRKPADGRYGAVRVLWSGCVVWNTSKSRARSMAGVGGASPVDRALVALLRNNGTTKPCATDGICLIEPPDT